MSVTSKSPKTNGNLENVELKSKDALTEKDVPSYNSGANQDAHTNGVANAGGSQDNLVQKLQVTQQTSSFATLMHLLKGNLNIGVLAMPNAVSNAGLALGTVGIPILGAICIHCMHLLVISSKTIGEKMGVASLDYSTTAEQAFRSGPKKVQFLAPFARHSVDIMLILTQFGFCCVYFLFVANSLYEVSENLFGSSPFSLHEFMAIIFPFLILFNFIRSLKRLSITTSIANFLLVVSFVMVFYFLVQGRHSSNLYPYTAPVKNWPLFFGTVTFAFEGIGVVLPLQNAMKTPEDFGGFTGVLTTGMIIVICLDIAVGFYGYLKYGNNVKPSITFSLPKHPLSETIRLTFALAIFLSHPLQFYVALSIIWSYLKEKFQLEKRFSPKIQTVFELLLRTFLVFVTCAITVAVPNLDLLISLVGALASSSLALIFPPIIELVMIWNTPISRRKLILIIIKDAAIIIFGIFGCFIGTYSTIKEIVQKMKKPS
ncbi:proton-coupled amino acid transporter 1-like [Parasteatoda tepidariorum]|uniref:proton-coupled amino acid transporter 1-like n=1 Tax=Parasteatoda tepidariorum TaxID=114398 RepID=UPI0039BC54A0